MKKILVQKIGSLGVIVALVGIVVSPVLVAAADDDENTTITATVSSAITVATSGAVGFTLAPTAGGVVSSASDTVSVSTNNASGYTLTLEDSDASNTLDRTPSGSFAAHAGTHGTPTALAANTWGYAVAGGNFDPTYTALSSQVSTLKFAGVPVLGAPQQIDSHGSVATNRQTTVWYAANATTAQAPGNYVGEVTYTATEL